MTGEIVTLFNIFFLILKAIKSLNRCHMTQKSTSNGTIDSGSDPQYAFKLY